VTTPVDGDEISYRPRSSSSRLSPRASSYDDRALQWWLLEGANFGALGYMPD